MDCSAPMAGAKKSSDERELDPKTKKILARLKKAREARGLSQARVAELAQVETSYVGLVERRKRIPSLPVLLRLAEAVGVAPAEFFSDAGLPPPRDPVELEELRALLLGWSRDQQRALLRIAKQIDRVRQR